MNNSILQGMRYQYSSLMRDHAETVIALQGEPHHPAFVALIWQNVRTALQATQEAQ